MKAVVLAAGEGKRMRPLTFTRPKFMIPLAGKPILEHVIDNLREAGVTEIVLVVKYMKEMVEEYFGDGSNFGVSIEYVEQGEKYGTAAAFAAAKDLVREEFLGIAGDIVTETSAIKKLLAEKNGRVRVGLKKVENPEKYGVAKLEGGKITELVEKPGKPESNLANTSIYVFGEGVMDLIAGVKESERGEYEVTDVIKDLIPKGEVYGVELTEYWMDIGMPWQFLDASEHLIEKMPERCEGVVEDSTIKGKVIIEEGARVFNSFIEGPTYIGKNTVVGPFVYIRKSTSIGDNCNLSSGTTVKNSILMNNVNAKHLTYIGDSIVGEKCNFGAGTQIANYKFDASTVRMRINEKKYDTEKKKFGVLVGDDTKTGVLACTMPGTSIGFGCWIGAGVVLHKNVPSNTKVFVKQELEYVENGD